MHLFTGAWHYAVPFVLVLTVLVYVHEMGHFLIARWAGVRVEVFSIGFGPELAGWTDRHRTRWKISALPFGGYVKMFGDANAASMPGDELDTMSPQERAVAFQHKSLGKRAAIVVAGPAANFIFALVALACLFATVGQPYTSPVIGEVVADSPAAKAGFEKGDRVTAINGSGITRFQQLQQIVEINLGAPLTIDVERGKSAVTLHATPEVIEQTDNLGHKYRSGRLGLRSGGVDYVRYDPLTALWRSGEESLFLTGATLKAMGQMIIGQRTTDELGGPLRIAQMSGEVAEGGVVSMVWFLAVLSLNLGLINLFPIPMLDGGHLLFYAAEAVRRRPLGPRTQDYGFRIGLTLILLLMLFATWNDLVHLFTS
jgi:regulator of sigma E protease